MALPFPSFSVNGCNPARLQVIAMARAGWGAAAAPPAVPQALAERT